MANIDLALQIFALVAGKADQQLYGGIYIHTYIFAKVLNVKCETN